MFHSQWAILLWPLSNESTVCEQSSIIVNYSHLKLFSFETTARQKEGIKIHSFFKLEDVLTGFGFLVVDNMIWYVDNLILCVVQIKSNLVQLHKVSDVVNIFTKCKYGSDFFYCNLKAGCWEYVLNKNLIFCAVIKFGSAA